MSEHTDEEVIEDMKSVLQSLIPTTEMLEDTIPRGVIDPRLWIKAHRPDLLEDGKVSLVFALMASDLDKGIKKHLRKSTRKQYTIDIEEWEGIILNEMLEWAIIDYEYSAFNINMAKSMRKQYFEYYWKNTLNLSIRELSMISKMFLNALEEIRDKEMWGEYGVDTLKLLDSFLTKKVSVSSTQYVPSINEDGTYGETELIREVKEITLGEAMIKLKVP